MLLTKLPSKSLFLISKIKSKMKLKQLESMVSQLTQFQNPKIELEQYATGAHIASRMLYMAENSYNDIRGKVVADLGCGCGTLSVAASLLSAEHVIGIDVDSEALSLASENASDMEVELDLIQGNIAECNFIATGWKADTVVMNPPFGTRKKGADIAFLSSAFQIAESRIYSLHKTSTRDFIKRIALRELGAKNAEVLCELRYNLPALYRFHKKQEVDIQVDLWQFSLT